MNLVPRFSKPLSTAVLGAALACGSPAVFAVPATLVATDTLVDQPVDGVVDVFGGGTADGFALNSPGFIDVAVYSFDFGTTTSVSSAQLTMTAAQIFGTAPIIDMFTYADDGVIQASDFTLGAGTVRDSSQYLAVGDISIIDVTAAVNDALATSSFVGFRFENARGPSELSSSEGVRFNLQPTLDFNPGNANRLPEPSSVLLMTLGLAFAARRARAAGRG